MHGKHFNGNTSSYVFLGPENDSAPRFWSPAHNHVLGFERNGNCFCFGAALPDSAADTSVA